MLQQVRKYFPNAVGPGNFASGTRSCRVAGIPALNRLPDSEITHGVKPLEPYPRHLHQECLPDKKNRILSSESPVNEATEVIFEPYRTMLNHFVEKTNFIGKHLFVNGTMLISTDPENGSVVEFPRLEERDSQALKNDKRSLFLKQTTTNPILCRTEYL